MTKRETSELIAECCVCGQHVPFKDGDRDNLLKHSQECHGGEKVVRYDILKRDTRSKASSVSRSSRKGASEDSRRNRRDEEPQYNFGHKMVCSKCGYVGPPLLKRRGRSKPLRLFAGCCPFLAMMWFFCCFTPRVAYLYCTKCKYYLGTYNTRNGEVTTPTKEEG